MSDNNIQILDFGAPEKEHSIIKVIGVGGGGSYSAIQTTRRSTTRLYPSTCS